MDNILEKAVHNQGDVHPNGKWYWEQSARGGKGDWRNIPKNGKTPKSSAVSAPKQELATDKPIEEVTVQYDAPKAKIQYQTKKPKYEFLVPEKWEYTVGEGRLVRQERKKVRSVYSKEDDASIIKLVSNHGSNAYGRMIAYEEAMARGIAEDKIDVSGTLQDEWDRSDRKVENKKRLERALNKESDATERVYDMSLLEGMDIDAFMEKFPNGDTGWKSPSDKRVKEEFNNLSTPYDRQRYDAFLDYQKRKDPYYMSVKKQLQKLNKDFAAFLLASPRALFVSAGGAGVGKSTSLRNIQELLGQTRYTDDDHPYDYILMGRDVQDEKDFMRLLHKHNGKIMVFDDKDKLLTSSAKGIVSTMKAIGDGNPDNRVFDGPDGQEIFTGKLVFLTNKDEDTLNQDEDHKAIQSRAIKNDIRLTVNEIIEVLGERYKTMGKLTQVTGAEEQEVRKKVYDIIVDNKSKLDPAKFTVRKFEDALSAVDAELLSQKLSQSGNGFRAAFGDDQDWEITIMTELNKGISQIDIQKAYDYKNDKRIVTPETVATWKALYKKDPAKFVELFGEEIVKVIKETKSDKKSEEKEIKKAIENEFSEMTLEQAESLLL